MKLLNPYLWVFFLLLCVILIYLFIYFHNSTHYSLYYSHFECYKRPRLICQLSISPLSLHKGRPSMEMKVAEAPGTYCRRCKEELPTRPQ